MLEHLNASPVRPERVVVAGAAGFVGGAIAARFERDGVPVLRLTRTEIDLSAADAGARLKALLRTGDAFIAAAARAPCKNAEMLVENVAMARSIVQALSQAPVAHVVNISSDAVYADSPDPLTEASCAEPASIHGAMHLAREVLMRAEVKAPLAILRPSLLYGADDPHNGYGPNRFRRLAERGENIVLFGDGEERRDHVYIGDLAEIAARVLYRRSVGVLNVATGKVHSFREIAERVAAMSQHEVRVVGSPRSGPMPHGGYRPFDVSACHASFPDLRFTDIETGLSLAQSTGKTR
jgi:nucleoside-diphosphate-sugar epimerase